MEIFKNVFDHYGLERTNNLKKIVCEWKKLCDYKMEIFNIDEYSDKKECNLGMSKFNKKDGLHIYLSNKCPEAILIHETLHFILRFKGYSFYGSLSYHEFADQISNNLEHLVINHRIKEYDLDFDYYYNLLSKQHLSNIEKEYNSERDSDIIIGVFLVTESLEFDFFGEYKDKLLSILKLKHQDIYEYRNRIINIIEKYDYLSKDEYNNMILDIREELKDIFGGNGPLRSETIINCLNILTEKSNCLKTDTA